MDLIRAALGDVDPTLVGPEALPVLQRFAVNVLQGGVVLGLTEWASLEQIEQQAFALAGKELDVTRARRVALAVRGEAGYHLAGADLEGTLEADRAAARAAVGVAAATLAQENAVAVARIQATNELASEINRLGAGFYGL